LIRAHNVSKALSTPKIFIGGNVISCGLFTFGAKFLCHFFKINILKVKKEKKKKVKGWLDISLPIRLKATSLFVYLVLDPY